MEQNYGCSDGFHSILLLILQLLHFFNWPIVLLLFQVRPVFESENWVKIQCNYYTPVALPVIHQISQKPHK